MHKDLDDFMGLLGISSIRNFIDKDVVDSFCAEILSAGEQWIRMLISKHEYWMSIEELNLLNSLLRDPILKTHLIENHVIINGIAEIGWDRTTDGFQVRFTEYDQLMQQEENNNG